LIGTAVSNTSPQPNPPAAEEEQIVDLRNPLWAAFLALLWPGLGHLYQRRFPKAVLLMVCILGTYFYGWWLGGFRTTYMAIDPPAARNYGFLAQMWVGLPAWPAIIQSGKRAPLGKDFMRPPEFRSSIWDGDNDLAIWYRQDSGRLEMGFVLTMIAGLLNVLAIFDAAAGPFGAAPATEKEKKKEGEAPPSGKLADGASPA
jgi:hypothetical protein